MAHAPFTIDDCRRYLDETTFRLRPSDYSAKYPKWPGAVGLEIEMLPVAPPIDGISTPSLVPLQGGEGTTAGTLGLEAARRGWMSVDTEGERGERLLLSLLLDEEGGLVSFEPGGQVEFSTKPYPCMVEAVRRLRSVQTLLDETYAKEGQRLVQVGINPWHTPESIGLQMPKARYRAMDRYYGMISTYGRRMMRQTCTVQVNLDFGPSGDTLARRYLAAQLIAPVAAATFAFSPLVDGESTGVVGFRSRIWRHIDPTHTGLPGLDRLAQTPTRAVAVETYLEFAMAADVVFVMGAGYRVPERPTSFRTWLETPLFGLKPTLEDFVAHLSLLFPEVRPRGFLELRSADCQPRALQAVPAAYWTGLLYDDQALDHVLELLLPSRGEALLRLSQAERGLADVSTAKLAKAVMKVAIDGFERHTPCFKSPDTERQLHAYFERYTARGLTPGDDIVRHLGQSGRRSLTWNDWVSLESAWDAAVG